MFFKKIIALGVGISFVGATLFGASAASLSDFPEPFVAGGQPASNLAVIIGDRADANDVIGAIEITEALQAAAVVPASEDFEVEGDYAEISSSSNMFEPFESMGYVRPSFSEVDLDMLKGGQIVTDEGSTEYNQYIRFNKSIDADGYLTFKKDERDKVGNYFYWRQGSMLFEYELEFEEGLESDVVGNLTVRDLEDLEDKDIFLLGKSFVIVDAGLNGDGLTLNLMSGVAAGILGENDEETYIVDGKEYNVELLVISETTAGGAGSVKFRINGEITDELRDGETDVLADGTQIGIRDILATKKDIQKSVVQFYIGAYEIALSDGNVTDQAFQSSGTKVNGEAIEDSEVMITGSLLGAGDVFELTDIKYRLYADTVLGDVNIPAGQGLRGQLDEPEGMLTPFWDILYLGMSTDDVTFINFKSKGDNKYALDFSNQEGIMYSIPFASAELGYLKYGDEDSSLWFVETESYVIGKDDLFVVGDCSIDSCDFTCFTHVFRYDSIDTANRELKFTDLGTGTREVVYDSVTNQGSLVAGGMEFLIDISGGNLRIDLNGDGSIINGTEVPLNTIGDALIGLGAVSASSLNGSYPDARPDSPDNFTAALVSIKLEESLINEIINITFELRPGSLMGIPDMGIYNSSGFFQGMYALEENEYLEQGFSQYGAFFELYDPKGDTAAEDLKIEYPFFERYVRVFLTGGTVEITTPEDSVPQIVPIQIGAAKLASEIADVTLLNAVIVGGPCANVISAQLMGNPEPCQDAILPGKAIIKLFEHANGNVAMLVAGRSAADTRMGCRAVAEFKIKDISGSAAEVSGTSLADINVTETFK